MVYTLSFFLFKMQFFFYNSNIFGSCIIYILYTGVLKLKKNNSGAKRLSLLLQTVPGALSPGGKGVKWPEREVYHSTVASANVQTLWSLTSIPHGCIL